MLNFKATELKVHQAVHDEIHRILSERDASVTNIAEACNLQAELGFTSLELLKLVSALDTNLHIDLLTRNIFIADLRTVGDVIQACLKSLPGLRGSSSADELLRATLRRARARRSRRDL